MAEALRGEAVIHLPRTSNNTSPERLRLARRVKWFNLLFSSWAKQIVPWLIWVYQLLTMELAYILIDC